MARTPSDWISLADAVQLLAASNIHFTPDTIGRWARSGRVQSIKLGNKRFVRRSQIRALLIPEGTRAEHDESQPVLFENL